MSEKKEKRREKKGKKSYAAHFRFQFFAKTQASDVRVSTNTLYSHHIFGFLSGFHVFVGRGRRRAGRTLQQK
jgi:hypothetical protein